MPLLPVSGSSKLVAPGWVQSIDVLFSIDGQYLKNQEITHISQMSDSLEKLEALVTLRPCFLQGPRGGAPTTPAAGHGSDCYIPLGLLTFESASPSLEKPFVCFSSRL